MTFGLPIMRYHSNNRCPRHSNPDGPMPELPFVRCTCLFRNMYVPLSERPLIESPDRNAEGYVERGDFSHGGAFRLGFYFAGGFESLQGQDIQKSLPDQPTFMSLPTHSGSWEAITEERLTEHDRETRPSKRMRKGRSARELNGDPWKLKSGAEEDSSQKDEEENEEEEEEETKSTTDTDMIVIPPDSPSSFRGRVTAAQEQESKDEDEDALPTSEQDSSTPARRRVRFAPPWDTDPPDMSS
ncbi:hypothetical protein GGR51DRAFT_132187 [Nemania sp. FL0031]|nr:hypothetical protein GGR51DRAFT_132187 [Nemania sp. FL0031]